MKPSSSSGVGDFSFESRLIAVIFPNTVPSLFSLSSWKHVFAGMNGPMPRPEILSDLGTRRVDRFLEYSNTSYSSA